MHILEVGGVKRVRSNGLGEGPTGLQKGGPRTSVSNAIYNNISLWFISFKVHFSFQ